MRELTEVTYGSGYVKPLDQSNIVLSATYTMNPTTINEMRLGQHWAGKLGIPNVSAETFPDFQNSGGGGVSASARAADLRTLPRTSLSRRTSQKSPASIR